MNDLSKAVSGGNIKAMRFPAWPLKRLLREAAWAWNLRNPDNYCDPATSDWPFVCNVVLTWLRHELTQYDRLVDPDSRDALRAQVVAAARKAYPWLRPETDPRETLENCTSKQKHSKILSEASADLADLVSIRAHLLEAKRREKDQAEKKAIESRIKTVEELIAGRRSLFATFADPAGGSMRMIVWDVAEYSFGCRRDLAPNYLKTAGFKCPRCAKTVYRTKRPIDLGAGIALICLSCECLSIAVSPGYDHPTPNAWASLFDDGQDKESQPKGKESRTEKP